VYPAAQTEHDPNTTEKFSFTRIENGDINETIRELDTSSSASPPSADPNRSFSPALEMPSRKQKRKADRRSRTRTEVKPTTGQQSKAQNDHATGNVQPESPYCLGNQVIPEHEDHLPFPIRPYTDHNNIDIFRKLKVQRDYLAYFTEPCKGSTPSWDAELIQKFCRDDKSLASTRPTVEVQIHDREYGSNQSREYPETLNAEQLRHALGVERFGEPDMPDASRRQIMVRNIDANVVHVLAETASSHQVDTLRDSISKHISGETSMKFMRQADGFDQPRIELHLPYLALRKVPHGTTPTVSSLSTQHEKLPTSFLVPDFVAQEGEHSDHCVIQTASISIVLSLWDRSKWVAYGFARLCPFDEEQRISEKSKETEDGAGEDDCGDEEVEPADDILVPDNGLHNMSAEHTIWDPRRYFLCVAAIWIDLVQREYKYLVHTLDANVKAWVGPKLYSSRKMHRLTLLLEDRYLASCI
jgi:hypothetical protein